MKLTFEFAPATGRPDKRFLIAVLVFGIVSPFAGMQWLSEGEIAIRQTTGHGRVAARRDTGKVAGRIKQDHALYYPICTAWIALGIGMITLAAMAYFTSKTLYLRLSAYSLALVLVLAFGTVGVAMWLGP